MTRRHKLGELIVPAIILLGCLLYWLHIQDARSVARRVPNGVILFTMAMTLLALLREFWWPWASAQETAAPEPVERAVIVKRAIFVLLCVGYYIAFTTIGFNLANLIFLLVAYMVAGMKPLGAVPMAVASTLVFHALAQVMEFNVPTGPLGL